MITHSELSHLAHRREGQLFLQLLEMLKFYDTFEVDDLKGTSMTVKDVTGIHYNKIQSLQKEIFRRFNSGRFHFRWLNI